MLHLETLTFDKLGERDFNRVVKLDARNWWNVLSREYGVSHIRNLHTRNELVCGKELLRLTQRLEVFPEGQIAVYCHEMKRPVGAISSLILKAPTVAAVPPTWHGATGDGYFSTHDPAGDMLICASIITLHTGLPAQKISDLRKQHISSLLLLAQHTLAEKLGVPGMIAYSRPMNYAAYVAEQEIIGEGYAWYRGLPRGPRRAGAPPRPLHRHARAGARSLLPRAGPPRAHPARGPPARPGLPGLQRHHGLQPDP